MNIKNEERLGFSLMSNSKSNLKILIFHRFLIGGFFDSEV